MTLIQFPNPVGNRREESITDKKLETSFKIQCIDFDLHHMHPQWPLKSTSIVFIDPSHELLLIVWR